MCATLPVLDIAFPEEGPVANPSTRDFDRLCIGVAGDARQVFSDCIAVAPWPDDEVNLGRIS